MITPPDVSVNLEPSEIYNYYPYRGDNQTDHIISYLKLHLEVLNSNISLFQNAHIGIHRDIRIIKDKINNLELEIIEKKKKE